MEFQTLCLSEKGRYVTLIGRIKENTTNLRKFHAAMDPYWNEVMDEGSIVSGLSGDLKYMLSMLGHMGASAAYPCPCCVRSRKNLGRQSWKDADMKHMRPDEAFRGDSQLRSYPANPDCDHDCKSSTCFCVDKGAEFIQNYIEEEHAEHAEEFSSTDQQAPFHKKVNEQAKEHTYSIVAEPLLPRIQLEHRLPGIWHCTHNTRQATWIMIKDAADAYGVLSQLRTAMASLGLPHIKVSAVARPKKECNLQALVDAENIAANQTIVDEEAKTTCNFRAGMDGTELEKVIDGFEVVVAHLEGGVQPEHAREFQRWSTSVLAALAGFKAGTAIALADVWLHNRAAEMGAHFRTFANEISGISKGCGLPYVPREYLAILPIHWLCEPDHLEAHASKMFESFGVAPGSGTDATTEMVRMRDRTTLVQLTAEAF